MILECGKCSKMYRVRDDAAPQPTACPTCGGALRAAGGGSPQTSAASRVKELETRIQNLERELEESRNAARPTLSVETAPGWSGPSPVAELRSAAEKSDRLEGELLTLRSEMEQRLKEKEQEITQVRESADRETAERRRQETRASGLEETHARALDGKDKTIAALDASIASYRAKVESIQKKLDAVEIQRLNDLNTFDSRVREREQSDRDALDRSTAAHQKALADLRAEMEAAISDKDRQISEGRQALDREAGERRRLTETLNRLQENAGREVAEKSTANQALEATLSSYKNKIETLQKRVDNLEQLRRTEHDQLNRQLSSRLSIRGRIDEANHLAGDLDHGLDSIEASIASLRDRARRLRESLAQSEAEAEAAPTAPLSLPSSLAPEPEPEVEMPKTVLSQTDIWDGLPSAPAAEPEAEAEMVAEPIPASEPEPEPAAEPEAEADITLQPDPVREPEPEAFTPVTRTQVRHNPYVEPLPEDIETVPSPEPSLLGTDPVSRLDEPSQMIPAAPPPVKPVREETDDLPLISGPEEEKPAAGERPAAKPEEPKRKKFSWQRK